MTALLQATGLSKSFGGLKAIDHVDFAVEVGEIRGLIGPNGSGKSTFFNLLSGVYDADAGSVVFNGTDITNWQPHDVAAAGTGKTLIHQNPSRKSLPKWLRYLSHQFLRCFNSRILRNNGSSRPL